MIASAAATARLIVAGSSVEPVRILQASSAHSGVSATIGYQAVFSNVTGLNVGDDVDIAGVRVGDVTSISVYGHDKALLLANRTIFQANRMPFLLRVQARLAAREILWDAVQRLLLGPDEQRSAREVKRRLRPRHLDREP